MCGILAICNALQSPQLLRERALNASAKQRHRGPDQTGVVVRNHVSRKGAYYALAHERLSIVNPESGFQPLFDREKDVCLSVNGEIYNHEAIWKDHLTAEEYGSVLSHSDCAVIPYLLSSYGIEKTVSLLDGMFAFIAVSHSQDKIYVARDPFGVCPLFIGYGNDGELFFSSEIKSIHHECLNFDIVQPGSFIEWSPNQEIKITQYYNPSWLSYSISSTPLNLALLKSLLEEAVIKRLMSNVPFGALLSGGLDSSIVAAIAQNYCHSKLGTQLSTFSVGLKDSPDLLKAREVATALGTLHREYIFEIQEGLDLLHEVIYHLESYDITTIRASIPLFILCRRIKSFGLKFVLSGEGADEIFGGYLYFHKAPNENEFHQETVRKLKDLHNYDLLRASKAPMAFGVEVRVPFLDKKFVNYAMSIDPIEKLCIDNKIEKFILRKAFEKTLPYHIIYRQKEQFSDGVGYAWIDALKHHADILITDHEMKQAKYAFIHNTPNTKEGYLYRKIFNQIFNHSAAQFLTPGGPSIACSTQHVMHWDETFRANADQSGRAVKDVHKGG